MKINKLATILFILFMISIIVSIPVFAATISTSDVKNDEPLGTAEGQIKTIGSQIFSGVYSVGVAISVIMIVWLGVKYMMGSSSDRADYKKSMIPYLVGAVLLFSASMIANMIYTVANQI